MLESFISYEVLRIIWWALLGVLLISFAVMDGFDLGVVVLLPFVARTDAERRVVINSVGPVWEGNQVWLILGAGAIFAAFPHVYAVAFSGLYLPMFLVLSAFIFRPVAFKYRSKMESVSWRGTWDAILCFTGLVPLLGFGLVVGNVLQGIPFSFDDDVRLTYHGAIVDLIGWFPLLCAGLSIVMCVRHGAAYLLAKTDATIALRATRILYIASALFLLLFVLGAWDLIYTVPGYCVTSPIDTGAHSLPLNKTVVCMAGGWATPYRQCSWLWLVPFLAVVAGFLSPFAVWCRRVLWGFVLSSVSIAATFMTLGLGLFPFLLPSSSHPEHSLTIWDASSSHLTLFVMLVATVIFLPIILSYTSFVYWVFLGKIEEKDIEKNKKDLY